MNLGAFRLRGHWTSIGLTCLLKRWERQEKWRRRPKTRTFARLKLRNMNLGKLDEREVAGT
jgi:hypothetical protein